MDDLQLNPLLNQLLPPTAWMLAWSDRKEMTARLQLMATMDISPAVRVLAYRSLQHLKNERN